MPPPASGGEPYQLLFDQNPQPMWVFDTESLEFLIVNDAAIRHYGYSRAEFMRMRISDIRPPEDLPALREAVNRNTEAFRSAGVWRHRRRDGTLILVEVTSHDIEFEGRRSRLVVAADVTEREDAIAQLRAGQESYERHYSALAALTRRGTLQAVDLDSAIRDITKQTALTLGIERVSVWRMTAARDAIIAQDLFERTPAQHSAGLRLDAITFPSYFQAIAESEVLVANDAVQDPRTREFADVYLRPNDISSMLDAPIVVDGELAGVLCMEHVGPQRTWTAAERSFAISAANLAALVLAQHSLTRSRAWLQTILDSEPECVSVVSPDGRLLEMNPAGLRMIEAPDRATVLGAEALRLVHPADRSAYMNLHRSVHGGATGQLQFRIIGLAGTERWIETHAAPLRSNGDVVAMLAVTRDISDRIRTEAALHESQRRLATLMDHLPGMAYRCRNDDGWTMEFVSDGSAALTGYTPTELLTGIHKFDSLIHPDDRDHVRSNVAGAVTARQPFEIEYRIIHANGSEKWVWERGHAVYDGGGDASLLEGFIADITQRRHSADELRHSEERFRLLARVTSDAIYDWDISSDHLWWSEGAETLFEVTRDELGSVLSTWTDRIHAEDRDRVMQGLHAAVEEGAETWAAEYRFRRGDGTWAIVSDRGHVIRDATGSAVRMIGGMSDITERRHLEGQLLHSQKMESVGRLAGGVAHDFNNLLTIILGTVDMALSGMGDADPLSAELGEVRRAAERAAGLTQQLLAFSRRQVLQPRVLDVNEVVTGALGLLHRVIGEDVRIVFEGGADLWHVRADPGQLEQVLLNLAINARDAMPTGGQLTLTTRNLMVDDAYAAGHPMTRTGAHIELTVSDTGIGMDADTREHAFEPFFTTKAVGEGTGLGLATVYGIVQQSGGSVRLYSEPGLGTNIRILLPRVDEARAAEAHELTASFESGSGTVLLVEDEDGVRRLTERVLSSAGYTVLSAAGGNAALELLDAHEGRVELLLTDVVMPEMNGPELARLVEERSPDTRILFMSGYTDDAVVRHGVPEGRTRFLEKPFTVGELTRAVRSALSG